MDTKKVVRLSNVIGFASIVLLVYWVFTFVIINIFGLKVFRENMTEAYYLSILGIIALMAGSLIVNIMFNLTIIAERDKQYLINKKPNKLKYITLISIFPFILIILFGGDYLTAMKKQSMLINSAKSIIEVNNKNSDKLINYDFSEIYIKEAEDILNILSGTDKNFPTITLIVRDSIEDTPVFLSFDSSRSIRSDNTDNAVEPDKRNYIYKTKQEERDYLNRIFDKKSSELRFSAHDGHYELFYPFYKNGKIIVFYFSEYQQYGK
jgi:hypothetical protein